MKIKEKQDTLRPCLGLVLWVCSLLLALSPLLCPKAIAATDYITENYNLIEEHSALLGKEINDYTELDTTSAKGISRSVTEAINVYRKKLIDLQSHADADDRLLEAEVKLAYVQGVTAGKLGWIYYYNTAQIKGAEALQRLEDTYGELAGKIRTAEDAEALSGLSNSLCNSLNRAVYTERIRELHREGDSVFCASVIAGALQDIAHVSSPDIFGEGYKAVYDSASMKTTLQRGRDSLNAQAADIFKVVCPDGDFSTDDNVSLLVYELQYANTLTEMNEAAREAFCGLVAIPEDQSYSYIYANRLCVKISEAALRADGIGEAANFLPLFESYPIDSRRAAAKDAVANKLLKETENSSELEEIEALFNGDGGIMDKCVTSAELEAEIVRADYCRQLYDAFSDTVTKLSTILGDYDNTAHSTRTADLYKASLAELHSLPRESAVYVENCNSILSTAKNSMVGILNEAKAERFLLDNKNIIVKPLGEISLADELPLKTALESYISLPTAVRSILGTQISSLVEKYKSFTNTKIRSLYPDDAFYLELCENICAEISALPTNNIDVFYNNCSLVYKKAEALKTLTVYYRGICGLGTYSSYTDGERTSLTDLCSAAAKELKEADISDADALYTRINYVLNNTIISIDRIAQYARVRIAARGSTSLSVEKLLANAKAVINATSDRAEMTAHADNAVFKIERVLTVETVISRSDEAKHVIESMKFLTSDEKILYCGRIDALKKSMADQAGVAESLTVLSFVWNSFTEELGKISKESGGKDLGRAVADYTALIEKELERLKTELGSMAHLSSERRDELIGSLVSIAAKFKTDAAAAPDSNAVAEKHTAALEQMAAIQLTASAENLESYKSVISAALDKLDDNTEIYSQKRLEEIKAIIDNYKQRLKSCTTLAACSALLTEAEAKVAAVNDLLKDAKISALSALSSVLEECRAASALYSTEAMETISRIYSEACAKISSFEKVSDVDALTLYLSEALTRIKSVHRDTVYSAGGMAVNTEGATYPEAYDIANGYWSQLFSSGGISYGASLSVSDINIEDSRASLQKLIRETARKGDMLIAAGADDSVTRLLRSCTVALGIDIALSDIVPEVDGYTLRMVLPRHLSGENVLGLVYVDDQGNTEFYPSSTDGNLMTVRLSHLSTFYIVTERTVNLAPLIIFLIILLVFEIIVFCFVLYLRATRKRKENDMLPPAFMLGINPLPMTFALRVKPDGGAGMALALSVAALALGCGIAFLLRAELPFLKGKKSVPEERSVTPIPHAQEKMPVKKEPLRLKRAAYLLAESETDDSSVACAVLTEEGEQDIDPISYSEPEDIAENEPYEDVALCRAEVNLDVIASKFREGELVDLSALKRKRLVNRRTDYVKILARGALTKPLIIEAQDFSRAAEEMLRAVGGEAIRVGVRKEG